MSKTRHKIKIQYTGCEIGKEYRAKVDELIASMEKKDGAYRSSISLIVRKKKGVVTTKAKDAININESEKLILDSLEKMALESSKNGKEPNKIKTEVEVEKEL